MKLVELVMLARVMSQRYGVDVQLSEDGNAFCTTERTPSGPRKFIIALPLVEDQGKYDKMVRGYLDHELAHVKYTDWSIWEKLACSAYFTHGFKNIWNIFEDVYVEVRMSKDYSGCRSNLRWLVRHLFTKEHVVDNLQQLSDRLVENATLSAVVRDFILLYLLHKRRGAVDVELTHSYAILDATKAALCKLSAGLSTVFSKVDEILVQPARSTQDTHDLAKGVYDVLAHIKGWECSVAEKKAIAAEIRDSFPQGITSSKTIAVISDVAGIFSQQIVQDYQSKSPADASSMVNSMQQVLRESAFLRNRISYGTTKHFLGKQQLFKVVKLQAAFSRTIPGLLQSVQYKPCRTGYTGKLAGRNLYRAAIGDGRLFMRKAERREQRVDVGILLDVSGSMGSKVDDALVCMYGLLGMLKQLPKIRSCAAGYSGDTYTWLNRLADTRVKNYFRLFAAGRTPTAGAVLQILPELSVSRTVRRLLFIITDGDPDNYEAFVLALQVAQAQGVEVYGIALYNMSRVMRQHFGDNHVVKVDSIQELPGKLAAMMKRALVKAVGYNL